MKQRPFPRSSCAAGAPRDALAQAALLSGNPVLGRGVAVLAGRDPLHLSAPAGATPSGRGVLVPVAGVARGASPAASCEWRGQPIAPERQAFPLAPALPARQAGWRRGDAGDA
ncbi:hypothetical protein [Bordetella bronchialis]|uniref:hypothetical protein n=1 Tax=Bordetella bronchialis TaxID=463025 RepID=UPI000A5BF0C1|nr:hypothetical protein [Bordetella bronchialis]